MQSHCSNKVQPFSMQPHACVVEFLQTVLGQEGQKLRSSAFITQSSGAESTSRNVPKSLDTMTQQCELMVGLNGDIWNNALQRFW